MSTRIRITSGLLGGRVLSVPRGIRPTSGRVRESLMEIWKPKLAEAVLLDLFAGSGAVGIEALSRGAAFVEWVEADRRVHRQLRANCRILDRDRFAIQLGRLPSALEKPDFLSRNSFDLVFADPPYDFGDYEALLEKTSVWLAETAEMVVEHTTRRQLPDRCESLERIDLRRYGDSALSFYRRESPTQD